MLTLFISDMATMVEDLADFLVPHHAVGLLPSPSSPYFFPLLVVLRVPGCLAWGVHD